jgi:hypothetical protein
VACGFRREGVRREAQLYPDGWKDFIVMGLLQSEYVSPDDQPKSTAALMGNSASR